jgi:hypothetical protein
MHLIFECLKREMRMNIITFDKLVTAIGFGLTALLIVAAGLY